MYGTATDNVSTRLKMYMMMMCVFPEVKSLRFDPSSNRTNNTGHVPPEHCLTENPLK